MQDNPINCDVFVIGAGMAGMAAALFAARKKLTVVQAGLTGETLYASGLFDLYGVTQGQPRTPIDDPWQAIEALRTSHPDHPFSKVSPDKIRAGMDTLVDFLAAGGYPYEGYADKNARLITPVGTIKRTYRVPTTMWAGVRALEERGDCMVVDIPGLRGFSAAQMVATLGSAWPGLRAASIEIPWEAKHGPKYAEHIARALQVEKSREELGAVIAPHVGSAKYVGLPAILGLRDCETIRQDLNRQLGVEVFEIPTMPPAIAGTRLKEAFDRQMPEEGVTAFYHHRVQAVERTDAGGFRLQVGRTEPEVTVEAKNVLLATGRFLGKGLVAHRQGIREALLDLPVVQPKVRANWHRETFLDPAGHAINLAGLAVDDGFRPLDAKGEPLYPNLYAAGSILAHQDWIRTKSGTGLAVATAYGAVEAMAAAGA